jgi:fibro-slime domain-containing protein
MGILSFLKKFMFIGTIIFSLFSESNVYGCVVNDFDNIYTYEYNNTNIILPYNDTSYIFNFDKSHTSCMSHLCKQFGDDIFYLGDFTPNNVRCSLNGEQYYTYITNGFFTTHVFINCSKTSEITNIEYIDDNTEIIYLQHSSGCPKKTSINSDINTRKTIDDNTIAIDAIYYDLHKIHPDLQKTVTHDFKIVKNKLDLYGNPVYNDIYHKTVTSSSSFYSWYHNISCSMSPDLCNYFIPIYDSLEFRKCSQNKDIWIYHNENFFPINNMGFGNEGYKYNYGFTSKIEFDVINTYDQLKISLSSDDDTWLFINGTLMIDNGGIHQTFGDTIILNTPHIGDIHHITIFYAERHMNEATLSITVYGQIIPTNHSFNSDSSSHDEESSSHDEESSSHDEESSSHNEESSSHNEESSSHDEESSSHDEESSSHDEESSSHDEESSSHDEESSSYEEDESSSHNEESSSHNEESSSYDEKSSSYDEESSSHEDESSSYDEESSSHDEESSSQDEESSNYDEESSNYEEESSSHDEESSSYDEESSNYEEESSSHEESSSYDEESSGHDEESSSHDEESSSHDEESSGHEEDSSGYESSSHEEESSSYESSSHEEESSSYESSSYDEESSSHDEESSSQDAYSSSHNAYSSSRNAESSNHNAYSSNHNAESSEHNASSSSNSDDNNDILKKVLIITGIVMGVLCLAFIGTCGLIACISMYKKNNYFDIEYNEGLYIDRKNITDKQFIPNERHHYNEMIIRQDV